MHLSELKAHHVSQLLEMAAADNIENANRLRKQELIYALLKNQARKGETIFGDGVLEILPDGFGFLRAPEESYLASTDDIYISPSQVRRFNLRSGDTIEGEIRSPKEGERYFALVKVDKVNGEPPEASKHKILFENLTPLHPTTHMLLERDIRSDENITSRVIDMIAPIGKGQRGLIVSPPKAGKTVLMQHIAKAITSNHPDVTLIVLLIDERPEEVTEMMRTVKGEVVASTFDEPATRHIQVADLMVERVRRLAEYGKDVVLLVDSLTRLVRAHNEAGPTSGRLLANGLDPAAFGRPRRLLATARNLAEGGSVTVIATILANTGSKLDEGIVEAFDGVEAARITLDRDLAQARLWPPVVLAHTWTRNASKLRSNGGGAYRDALRTTLSPEPDRALDELRHMLRTHPTNDALLHAIQQATPTERA